MEKTPELQDGNEKPIVPKRAGTFYAYKNSQYLHSKTNGPMNYSFKVEKPQSKDKTDSGKNHICKFEGCSWSFQRQSDLRRHVKSHQEPMFHCPYWKNDQSCHRNGGSFNRSDVLKRHLRLVHYVQDKRDEGDSGWCRNCQRMFQSSKVFVDHCVDCLRRVATT